MESKQNYFEKHPTKTIVLINLLIIVLVWILASLKLFNGPITEHEPKALKTIAKQAYFSRIIDSNVGRFIKLREYPPNHVTTDRPSRFIMENIAPNSIERKHYLLRTDEHGFILGPQEHHEAPDHRIVFLGGSTTECLYVDEDLRFPYLVRQQLESITGKKINAYNGGKSGNESMHSLNVFMNKVLPIKPDIAVLMHNINDLCMLRAQGGYGYPMSHKSHVQTAKNVFTRHEYPPLPVQTSQETIKQEFTANLRTFISIARIRNIKPVLMTQANRVEGDPLYHEFNQIIRDIGVQEEVMVIDLAKLIPQDPQCLYDSYHYTAQGSQKAAQVIVEHLKPLLA